MMNLILNKIKKYSIPFLIILFFSANIFAYTPVATDSRIKTLVYSPSEIFNLKFHYNFQSYIEFPQNEEIQIITLGDRHPWNIKKVGQRIFIKPYQKAVVTNMTIITDQRPYHFEIESSTLKYNEIDPDLSLVIKFYYPDKAYDFMNSIKIRKPIKVIEDTTPINKEKKNINDNLVIENKFLELESETSNVNVGNAIGVIDTLSNVPNTLANNSVVAPTDKISNINSAESNNLSENISVQENNIESSPDDQTSITASQNKTDELQKSEDNILKSSSDLSKNYAYSMVGPEDSNLVPLSVYDDGVNTYFKFDKGFLPDIFYVNQDGTEILAEYRIIDGNAVVRNTSWQFSLRNNSDVLCIFNDNKIEVNT